MIPALQIKHERGHESWKVGVDRYDQLNKVVYSQAYYNQNEILLKDSDPQNIVSPSSTYMLLLYDTLLIIKILYNENISVNQSKTTNLYIWWLFAAMANNILIL